MHAADHAVVRADQVVDHRLHPAAAGRADRERGAVLGAERRAQQLGDVLHDLAEGGVEVADRRLRQRVEHALGDGRRAGAEQEAFGHGGEGCHSRRVPARARCEVPPALGRLRNRCRHLDDSHVVLEANAGHRIELFCCTGSGDRSRPRSTLGFRTIGMSIHGDSLVRTFQSA